MFMLNRGGLLFSSILGLIFYFFGGIQSLVVMFVFLISSVFVTRFGYYEKKEIGLYEYERGWRNVFSNGLMPTLFLIYYFYSGNIMPFLGSVAAITADKFSSELGIFEEDPIDLLTFKKTKRGKSGAVSSLGLFASLIGSGMISLASYFIYDINYTGMLLIMIAGIAGSIADSIAGTLEERGFGTKETSNMIGSLVGGITCLWGF